MYIKRIICENTGPIEDAIITFELNNEGNPIPCILVGENGSGKSIVLSYIADSFYELAEQEYSDATKKTFGGHEYFKVISPNQIHVGSKYFASFIEFTKNGEEDITYFCKSGAYLYDFIAKYNLISNKNIQGKWKQDGNNKGVFIDKATSKEVFLDSIMCYFPPSRYEKPNWLGENYYSDMRFSSIENFSGHLRNPVSVNNVTESLMQWILDIIADSRGDLEPVNDGQNTTFTITYPNVNDIIWMATARKNIEEIMGTILGQKVKFKMGFRNVGKSRLSICDTSGNIVVPSLDALSTGQMALFLLFATIAMYADHLDMNKSIHLNQIKGIVAIDEIDLHLHSRLQREVLSKLMRLFPKIQFIISTHSPLVLLGLSEAYSDEISIIEMPSGRRISAEQFNEFERAYTYYSATEHFRNDIRKAIDNNQVKKPLIITEGATDWRHIKAAYNNLANEDKNKWLSELDFELLEYDPDNSDTDNPIKISMSADELKNMVMDYSKVHQARKMIFIADNDKPDVSKKLTDPDRGYKSWGNNVFSLTIPVPEHRKDTPSICIENLYKDADIKKWVITPDYKRRVFIGNEFDKNGVFLGDDQLLCCDKNACEKIQIIDGNGSKKVISPFSNDKDKNYALPKMSFAKMVLEQDKPFDTMCFDGFLPLFNIIKDIIKNEPTV